MPTFNFEPEYLAELECAIIASRQMLSFILDPDADPESLPKNPWNDPLLSLNALPEGAIDDGPALFKWRSQDIYDVDGLLLFRDQALDLGSGNEWRVRVAASDVLRTPVKCIRVGPSLNLEELAADARAELEKSAELAPLTIGDEKDVRLVCYNYPNIGIRYTSLTQPGQFVSDIDQQRVVQIDSLGLDDNPESITTVWSPYDIVARSTVSYFRSLWERKMALLPSLPDSFSKLPAAIKLARLSIEDAQPTRPPLTLIPQVGEKNCAAATARMILNHYGKDKPETVLASLMNTRDGGATPEAQVNAINSLFPGVLTATPDTSPDFDEARDEILANHPLRTASPGHARAVGGFRSELGEVDWLLIYDPEPAHKGRICMEIWDREFHRDFIYVRPS